MKKLTILSALALTLGLATVTSAQDTNPTVTNTVKTELQSQIRANQDKLREAQEKLRTVTKERKEETKELRKEVKEMRVDFRSDVAKKRAEVSTKVFTDTMERFSTLIMRIESRIEKTKTAGGVTTEAEAFLALAKTNIAEAKVHMDLITATTIPTDPAATTTARANFDKIKTEAKLVREALTEAKQNLMRAVQALQKSEKAMRKTATTTPEKKENNQE